MFVSTSQAVHGRVSPGFERVRDAFADNFVRRGELGGACCVYHRGEKVVDIWGGIRNKDNRRAVGARHDGDRLFGHEGPGRDDACARALPRLARLRRAGLRLLAGVRAAG